MAAPREILSRTGRGAQGCRMTTQAFDGYAEPVREHGPAPVPPPLQTPPEERIPAPTRIAVPQPIREKSVYRQLMKAHDRMGTRHLQ